MNYLQDWLIKRKGPAGWACCFGETETCSKEEGVRSHAGKTLIWEIQYASVSVDFMNVYREREKSVPPIYLLSEINTEEHIVGWNWNLELQVVKVLEFLSAENFGVRCKGKLLYLEVM